MNPIDIIDKYYPQDNELKHILLVHSQSVADKALWIAARHPELNLDVFRCMLWYVKDIRVPGFH